MPFYETGNTSGVTPGLAGVKIYADEQARQQQMAFEQQQAAAAQAAQMRDYMLRGQALQQQQQQSANDLELRRAALAQALGQQQFEQQKWGADFGLKKSAQEFGQNFDQQREAATRDYQNRSLDQQNTINQRDLASREGIAGQQLQAETERNRQSELDRQIRLVDEDMRPELEQIQFARDQAVKSGDPSLIDRAQQAVDGWNLRNRNRKGAIAQLSGSVTRGPAETQSADTTPPAAPMDLYNQQLTGINAMPEGAAKDAAMRQWLNQDMSKLPPQSAPEMSITRQPDSANTLLGDIGKSQKTREDTVKQKARDAAANEAEAKSLEGQILHAGNLVDPAVVQKIQDRITALRGADAAGVPRNNLAPDADFQNAVSSLHDATRGQYQRDFQGKYQEDLGKEKSYPARMAKIQRDMEAGYITPDLAQQLVKNDRTTQLGEDINGVVAGASNDQAALDAIEAWQAKLKGTSFGADKNPEIAAMYAQAANNHATSEHTGTRSGGGAHIGMGGINLGAASGSSQTESTNTENPQKVVDRYLQEQKQQWDSQGVDTAALSRQLEQVKKNILERNPQAALGPQFKTDLTAEDLQARSAAADDKEAAKHKDSAALGVVDAVNTIAQPFADLASVKDRAMQNGLAYLFGNKSGEQALRDTGGAIPGAQMMIDSAEGKSPTYNELLHAVPGLGAVLDAKDMGARWNDMSDRERVAASLGLGVRIGTDAMAIYGGAKSLQQVAAQSPKVQQFLSKAKPAFDPAQHTFDRFNQTSNAVNTSNDAYFKNASSPAATEIQPQRPPAASVAVDAPRDSISQIRAAANSNIVGPQDTPTQIVPKAAAPAEASGTGLKSQELDGLAKAMTNNPRAKYADLPQNLKDAIKGAEVRQTNAVKVQSVAEQTGATPEAVQKVQKIETAMKDAGKGEILNSSSQHDAISDALENTDEFVPDPKQVNSMIERRNARLAEIADHRRDAVANPQRAAQIQRTVDWKQQEADALSRMIEDRQPAADSPATTRFNRGHTPEQKAALSAADVRFNALKGRGPGPTGNESFYGGDQTRYAMRAAVEMGGEPPIWDGVPVEPEITPEQQARIEALAGENAKLKKMLMIGVKKSKAKN